MANTAEFLQSPFGSGLLSAATSTVNGVMDWINAGQQRRWSEEMMDKQNQWSLDMWNMTNEYNSPVAQVQRLRDAGLNPMYYGLDGSSANSFQSAQPMSYQRASAPLIGNPIEGMLQGKQMQVAEADIKNKEADTALKRANAGNAALDAEFKQKTMDARVEGENLANEAKSAGIKLSESQRNEISQNIKESEERCKTEGAKRFLMDAQSWVQKATYDQIIRLVPYQERLMSAQSQYQSAAADLAFVNAATQEGLLMGGYVEFELGKLQSDIERNWTDIKIGDTTIDLNTAMKDVKEFEARIRNGEAIDVDSIPKWMLTDRIAASFWNRILQRSSEVSEAASGVIGPVAGFAVGKAAKKSSGSGVYKNPYMDFDHTTAH